jgi:cytochrome P450
MTLKGGRIPLGPDDWLGDYFVPAGTETYVSPCFIHRHPDIWEDPDRFNPDRFKPDL